MFTTILIATIIHMNIGFELPEAFWRGVGTAAILAGIGLVVAIVIGTIVTIFDRISK